MKLWKGFAGGSARETKLREREVEERRNGQGKRPSGPEVNHLPKTSLSGVGSTGGGSATGAASGGRRRVERQKPRFLADQIQASAPNSRSTDPGDTGDS